MMRRLLMGSLDAGFRPESQELFARMSPTPNIVRRLAINDLVNSLIVADVWDDLDQLFVFAATNTHDAVLNWKGTTFPPIVSVDGTTFTADRGYSGATSPGSLSTGYWQDYPGGQFIQDSHTFGRWALDVGNISGGVKVMLGARRVSNNTSYSIEDQASFTSLDGVGGEQWIGSGSLGSVTVTRNSPANFDTYLNGVSLGNHVASSGDATFSQFALLARNNGGTIDRNSLGEIGAAWFGGGIDATKAAALHTAVEAYLTSVGAI